MILDIWYVTVSGGPRHIERMSSQELERIYALYSAMNAVNAQEIGGESTTDKQFRLTIRVDTRP